LNIESNTSGRIQYPNTEAVLYASIPCGLIKFNNAYIDALPINATP